MDKVFFVSRVQDTRKGRAQCEEVIREEEPKDEEIGKRKDEFELPQTVHPYVHFIGLMEVTTVKALFSSQWMQLKKQKSINNMMGLLDRPN